MEFKIDWSLIGQSLSNSIQMPLKTFLIATVREVSTYTMFYSLLCLHPIKIIIKKIHRQLYYQFYVCRKIFSEWRCLFVKIYVLNLQNAQNKNAFFEIQKKYFHIGIIESFPIFHLNLFKLIFDRYQHLVSIETTEMLYILYMSSAD